jgi:hypothetical protein
MIYLKIASHFSHSRTLLAFQGVCLAVKRQVATLKTERSKSSFVPFPAGIDQITAGR